MMLEVGEGERTGWGQQAAPALVGLGERGGMSCLLHKIR